MGGPQPRAITDAQKQPDPGGDAFSAETAKTERRRDALTDPITLFLQWPAMIHL